ncbi:lipopolysaccharide biosynthesis protein [Enterococcus sp. AZ103]|uniref:lipopolysaccharide biosynthesis protein n=1 Tax=Enterococcus sp. AZ103 TaxID=2774628 RepID=UPI003F25D495
MNTKTKNLLKNLRYTLSANFLVLGISLILNIVVPKFISTEAYSYWQLYVFYGTYVGFFHFGWLDGIYLKTGGKYYQELDKKSLGSQFWYLMIFETFLTLIVGGYGIILHNNKGIVLLFTATLLVVTNSRTFILYILESTNRFKEYAQLSRSDRYLYLLFLVGYLLAGGRDFIWLLAFDVLAKGLVTLWGMYLIRDLLKGKIFKLKFLQFEIGDNLKIGSNLLISNLASMFILGITRIFVERSWSINTFGKLSFTLSMSNLFMTFINAVGVVMFPLLRRTNQEQLPQLYQTIRNVFVPITFAILLTYQPISFLLNLWLPQYQASLIYMGVLFPTVIYEGRMALLVNTYLKTMRQERTILMVNLTTLFLSTALSALTVFIFHNILLTVGVILLSLVFRCIFAEKMLTGQLKIKVGKQNIQELILVTAFVFGNLLLTPLVSFLGYFALYGAYLLINLWRTRDSLSYFLVLIKKTSTAL